MPFYSLDLRQSARRLARDRGFTAAAGLTFAVGIGAAITVFAVFSAVLVRPLPFADSDRIVYIMPRWTGGGSHQADVVTGADFLEIRDRARGFRRLAALEGSGTEVVGQYVLKTPSGAIFLASGNVTWNFFDALGAKPLLGRTFEPRDEESDLPRVVMLTEQTWRSRFGSDPNIAGRMVQLDGIPLEVVGVMPASFRFPPRADIWIPTSATYLRKISRRVVRAVQPLGPLADGVSLASAQAEADALAADLARRFPATNEGRGVRLVPLREALAGSMRTPLTVLFLATLVLVVIAAVNVANLQLSRATARGREFAIRAALGAGQGRIARLLLVEGVLLAGAGASFGGIAGALALKATAYWQGAANLPLNPVLDWRVLLCAAGLVTLAALVCGMTPAFVVVRVSLTAALRDGSAGASARSAARRWLAGAQIALALTLLVCAGLMRESLRRLTSVDHGFRRPENISTMLLTFPPASYPNLEARRATQNEILRRVKQIPGVQDAGLVYELPMKGVTFTSLFRTRPTTDEAWLSTDVHWVSPGALPTLGAQLVRGRWFRDDEVASGAARVIIVNQEFVRTYLRDTDPIGMRLSFQEGAGLSTEEVIGVVGDLRHRALDRAASPAVYKANTGMPWCYLLVRARPGAAVTSQALNAVRAAAADQPAPAMPKLDEVIDESIAEQRNRSRLIVMFGAVATLLACIGVYGVVAFSVSQQSREIAVRLAIGAEPRDVVRMVLRQAATIGVGGLAVGLVLARIAAQSISPLLFCVSAGDAAVYGAACAILMTVLLIASIVPALRASRLEPAVVLKQQ